MVDEHRNYVDCNEQALLFLECSREELFQKNVADFIPPGKNGTVLRNHRPLWDDGGIIETEYYIHGSIKTVLLSIVPVIIDGKKFMFGIGNDITEQRQSEQKVKMSEEKYRTLFNTMAQGVVYQDANGEIISANPAAEKILGLSLNQMQGRTSMDPQWKAVDKDKQELSGENHPAMIALRTGETVTGFLQGVFNPEKNDYVWIIVNSVPQYRNGSETPYQVYSTFLDVTKRIQYEQVMKEANSIINKSNHVAFTWKNDEHWSVDYVTENVEKVFGYTKDEFTTQTINYEACIHQDDIKRVKNELQNFISDPLRDEFKHEPYRIITKEGEIKWVDDWSYIIRDEHGTITHYKGIIEDITKRKTAEIALQESQQSFKCLFENSQNGIVICELIKDEEGKPVDYVHLQVNPSTEKQLGYKPETLVNKTAKELIGDEKGLEYAQKNGSCVLSGKPYSWVDFVPFYERYLRMDSFSLKDDLFAITFIDISKEVIKEKQLIERVKELQGMKKLRETLEKSERYDTVFSEFVTDIVPKSMQYPEKTYAKVLFDGKLYCNHPNIHEEDIPHLSKPIMVNQQERGKVIIGYIEELPFIEQYEDDLIWNYAEIFNDYISRIESAIELRESEKRYRSYINNAPNAIFITDAKRNIVEVNDSFCRMSGYSKQELSTMKMIDLFDSDTPDSHGCFEVLDKQGIVSGEKCIIHKDGSKRWWGVNAVKLSDERFLGFSQDITEKKHTEEKERFLGDIVRTASVAIAVGYPDGRIGINNDAFQKLTGYTKAELKNVDWNQMTPEKWRRIETEKLEELHSTKNPVRYEKEYIRKDGSIVPIELMVHGYFDEQGEIEYYKAFITDISDRKESEKALRESEEIFRQTFENATVGYSLTKPDGTLSKVNHAFASMLGYSVEELSNMNFADVTHPDDIAESKECVRSLLAGEKNVHKFEKRYYHKNGSIVWTNIGATLLRDETHNPLFFITSIQDITDKKQAEKVIKQSESKYRLLAENSIDCIWTLDKRLRFTYLSPSLEKMTGFKAEDWIGTKLKEHFTTKEFLKVGLLAAKAIKNFKTFEPIVFETRMLNKDNEEIDVEITGKVLIDENGKLIGLQGTTKVITERKKARMLIAKKERKYRNLVEDIPDVVFELSDDGIIKYVSPKLQDLLGYIPEGQIGKSFTKFIYPDDLNKSLEGFEYHKNDGQKPIEFRMLKKNGDIIWVSLLGKIINEDNKNVFRGVFRDITEMKKTYTALEISEKKYKAYINNAPNGVFICDEHGRYLEVNDEAMKTTGYSKDELLNMSVADTIPEEGKEQGLQHFQTLLQKGESSGELPFIHKDGSVRWWQVNAVQLSDERFLGFTQDITDKKHAESQLIQSKKETEMILNTAADGIRIVTKDFKIKTMNDTITEMSQTTKEDGIGQYCYDVFKSKNCGTENCSMVRILRAGEGFEEEEIRINPDGRQIPCISKITPYKDENDEIIGIIEDFRDITSVLETEARFQNIFENKGTAMGTFGDDGIITMCNSKFEEISGFRREELLGKMKWSDFVVKEDLERMMKYHRQRSEGGNPPSEYTCDIIDKKGQRKTMIVNIGVMPNSKERIVSLTDITKQKTAEKELIIAHEELQKLNKELEKKVDQRTEEIKVVLKQKDEFINQLGHDLKNPLGPLLNLLPIVEKNESDPKQKEMLHVINRNVKYMKNLVTKTIQLAQLKSPSTGLKYEQIDLRNEINEILSNNQLFFDEYNVNVENLISEPLMIEADKLKLQEVFNNLLNNAVKYSNKEGGNIIINQVKTDDDVTIYVQDSGIGITAEQLEKVFNEFYKADGSRHDFESSGLGMPICKRIIEMHGGKIWVESKGLGKGSTFYFTLPIHTQKNQ